MDGRDPLPPRWKRPPPPIEDRPPMMTPNWPMLAIVAWVTGWLVAGAVWLTLSLHGN